jgi:mono/diheme cytochrome c family protein
MNRENRVSIVGTVLCVAGVYAYFLLFAQFAFLERIKAGVGEGATLKAVLGLMALGGIGSGFVAARAGSPRRGLACALILCAVVAGVAALSLPGWMFPVISFVTGASMGTATVCLAGRLAGIPDRKRGCVWLGWGTGLAYGFCNIPSVFTASPGVQCVISAVIAVVALAGGRMMRGEAPSAEFKPPWRAMLVFGALVWMDAAAFYVIQHAPELKQGTWREEFLWRNAAVHLAVAGAAGYWLARGGLRAVWVTAWALLALAAWWVNFPEHREWAGWLYPVGVSLYSTALVAWAPLLAEHGPGKNPRAAMFRAAWLFGVAGWLASGAGIGMVESLQRVPGIFLLVSGVAVLAGALIRGIDWRNVAAFGVVGFVAWKWRDKPEPAATAIERGHAVYLAEGCIHCHTRYVRPDSGDEKMWGAAEPPESIKRERPVLIGNRRQGPDLLHVGGRRSTVWLREHFRDPRVFAPDSSMPSYVRLLDDGRADDLIAWLRQDAAAQSAEVWAAALNWRPERVPEGNLERGREQYARSCAVCHGAEGRGDGRLAPALQTPPRNLVAGPFGPSLAKPGEEPAVPLMRVVRFGIPGTDMPGHETWPDQTLADVAAWVLALRAEDSNR